jgi:predicted Na+-dependent transporter
MKKQSQYMYHLIISIIALLAILFLFFGNYKSTIFKYSLIFICLINMIINSLSYYKKRNS